MERVGRRGTLTSNLPQLQHLIKKDSSTYKEEFLQQYQHYQALLRLFLIDPTQESLKLQEVVTFLSQVCHCYPEETASFPGSIQALLQQHGSVLHSEVRMSLCRALILMRNKDYLPAMSILQLFFELFRCQDKALRKVLYTHIVCDIKRINSKHRSNQVNKGLQNFMYSMLMDSNPVASKMSLDVMIEMYRKNVWKDAKTVNVITTACFSPFTKVVVGALLFFVSDCGGTEADDVFSGEEDSDGEICKAERTINMSKRMTKGRKRGKKVAKVLAKMKKKKRNKSSQSASTFSALHLINDPQSFTEELFKKLEHSKDKFEVRLLLMSLISRLIGIHQLFLFNFYPFVQRYLQPHQHEVTKVLTYLAQASHELVPAEVLESSLRAIVTNFISERNSSEVMTVGLNAIREICVRCPLCVTSELLHDLSAYKSHHSKSVMMAARSLIQLFRDLNPQMLKRKDRGKPTECLETCKVREYGEVLAPEYVPGTEVIAVVDKEDSSDTRCVSELPVDKPKLAKEEVKRLCQAKAMEISHSKILNQEEFKAIKGNQHTPMLSSRGKKQIYDLLRLQEERRAAAGEVLSEDVIETVDHKKQRLDKDGRLQIVQAGRVSKKKYGYRWRRMQMHNSTTNEEKRKSKPFMMVKHKRTVRGKNKRSFREKQMKLRTSLLKQKGTK